MLNYEFFPNSTFTYRYCTELHKEGTKDHGENFAELCAS